MTTTSQKSYLAGYQVELIQIDKTNYRRLLEWRNQPEIRHMMRHTELIDEASHDAWFTAVQKDKSQQHFIIRYKDEHLGAINIRSLDRTDLSSALQAEVGVYMAHEKYKGNIIAFAPSLLINDYAFDTLNMHRLASEVKETNQAAIKYNRQLGYNLQDKTNGFIAIELTADNYRKQTTLLKRLLSR